MWRMVGWLVASGVAAGVVIAILIELRFYAGGGVEEVVGALGRGALIGGIFGVPPGIVYGLALAVLTLTFAHLPERTGWYRMTSAAVCAGVALVGAVLSAFIPYDEPPGMMFLIPTPFQIVGIPLLITAPCGAVAAQGVAKVFSRRTDIESR